MKITADKNYDKNTIESLSLAMVASTSTLLNEKGVGNNSNRELVRSIATSAKAANEKRARRCEQQ